MSPSPRRPAGRRKPVLPAPSAPLAALAAAAALTTPAAAAAAIGDLAPLGGLAACNATTGSFTGVCEPGSPIRSAFSDAGTNGRHVLTSPDGKHVYVLSRAESNDGTRFPTGSIGVFSRGPGGALTPTSCVIDTGPPPPPQTPTCVSSGNPDVDSAIANGGARGIESNKAAITPDGSQLFVAGQRLAVLDRDPATGALTGRQAVGTLPPDQVSIDVAVSPDGANVYEVVAGRFSDVGPASRLNVFQRRGGGLQQTQCFNVDASGFCKRLGGLGRPSANNTASMLHVKVSPDGGNVYVSDGRTIIPLARNADRSLAPLTDTSGFGKQAGCITALPTVGGCLSQSVNGLAVSDLEIAPDGRHVYAGNFALRRTADGRLVTPTPAPLPLEPSSCCGAEIAVSPDGQTVYFSEFDKLAGISRDPRSMTMSALPGPLGCVARDGSSGCQTAIAGTSAFFRDLTVDPSGTNLYLTDGAFTGPTMRSFSRLSGPPLAPPTVGRADLTPRNLRVTASRAVTLTLMWEHPRNWNALTHLELRLRARGRVIGRVVFDKRSDRVRLAGGRGLRLLRSPISGNGKTGRRLTLRAVLSLAPTLTARTLLVDASARDRRGHRQTITQVGTLRIKRAR